MNRLLLIPLVCLIVAVPSGKASAIHKCGSRCVTCPSCNQGCCSLDVSEGKVKKTYWTIETEQICVPNFLFPWQCPKKSLFNCGCGKKGCGGCSDGGCSASSGCSGACGNAGGCRYAVPGHKGGRVKTIRVLKKHSYECPVCLYKWSAKGGGGCGNGCSGNCSCQSASQDEGSHEPAPDDSPEPPVSEPSASEPTAAESATETWTPEQSAPAEPALGNEPLIEEPISSERPVFDAAPQIAPQAYNQRIKAPEPSFSILDPFTKRAFGAK